MDQFVDCSGLSDILGKAPGNPVIWGRFLSRLAELAACNSSYIVVTDPTHREKVHLYYPPELRVR